MRTRVEPAVHGALDFAELERLGLRPDDVLDFSVNSNAFGPSPRVGQVLSSVPIDRYPDRESIALRRALSERLDVSIEQIVAGNGTAELIWLAACALLHANDEVLILGPTFGEYERCARLMNAAVHHVTARSENGFAFDEYAVDEALRVRNFRLVFLCNPNNPTGQTLSLDVLDGWAQGYPDTFFVVDEAYLAFVPGLESAVTMRRRNILVLRSMTKDYALAGLRLGYAAGDEEIVRGLTDLRPAWDVNALAQAAGLAALQDEEHLRKTLRGLIEEKQNLVHGLKALGYSPVPSPTHYFLLPVGDAAHFRGKLLQRGILVRDCASFGLPGYVRIAARKPEENARLLQAVEETFP